MPQLLGFFSSDNYLFADRVPATVLPDHFHFEFAVTLRPEKGIVARLDFPSVVEPSYCGGRLAVVRPQRQFAFLFETLVGIAQHALETDIRPLSAYYVLGAELRLPGRSRPRLCPD